MQDIMLGRYFHFAIPFFSDVRFHSPKKREWSGGEKYSGFDSSRTFGQVRNRWEEMDVPYDFIVLLFLLFG
jgi:hypothetical protein